MVVPVYGCAPCLPVLVDRVLTVCEAMETTVEIVLVDDRSPDGSWAVITGLVEGRAEVRGVRLSRNFGQHAAITAGLTTAQGRWVVVMDCDLQDPPELIPELYHQALQGYDVVLGRRRERGQSRFRRIAARIYFQALAVVSEGRADGAYSGFSILSRRAVDAFLRFGERDRYFVFLVRWIGLEQTEIVYDRDARAAGGSSYTVRALLRHAATGFFFQTTALLRLIVWFGLGTAGVGVLLALYFLFRYLTGTVAPGFTSVILVLLVLGGAILTSVGVVGLYIGRIFEQSKARPLFVVQEVAGGRPQAGPTHNEETSRGDGAQLG